MFCVGNIILTETVSLVITNCIIVLVLLTSTCIITKIKLINYIDL